MEFNDFLNRYKEEALQIDLKKEQFLAYEILELKKMKLNSVTFEYEIDEVIEFGEKAIVETKETLNRVILTEHYKTTYKSGIPLFLSQMKGYFEYLELYTKAIAKKKQFQHSEVFKSNELLKNPYDKIFSSDFAYTLFDKMKECYNDSSTKQADYSNLFEIMQKDKSIISSGVDFISLLSKYDINITKIDSSKTGNKKKTILYNSIKENLQKKHGLSTI